MSRDPDHVFCDPEVLELLEKEPELLAIVDAIAATQARRQSGGRRPIRGVLAAVLAASVVLAALLVPWSGERGAIEERAFAAVGDGEIVHAVLSTEAARDVLVIELSSGERLRSAIEVESWFDTRRSVVRTITRQNGTVIADVAMSRADALSSAGRATDRSEELGAAEVAATLVAVGYRRALEAGEARVVGQGIVGGRRAVWLEFAAAAQQRAQVAVDDKTGRPLRLRLLGGDSPTPKQDWPVAKLEALPTAPAGITRTRLPDGPSDGAITSSREASLAEAEAWLGVRVVSPGNEVEGLRLVSVRLQVLSRAYPHGVVELGRGVELIYRGRSGSSDPDRYLHIRQAEAPEPAYDWVQGRLTSNRNPIPRDGVIAVARGGNAWLGQLRSKGLYVTLHGRDRAAILAAARKLAHPTLTGG